MRRSSAENYCQANIELGQEIYIHVVAPDKGRARAALIREIEYPHSDVTVTAG